MNEQGNAAGCVRENLGEAITVESERAGSRAQGHGDSQGGSLIGEPVSEESVDHGERVVTPGWHGHEQAQEPLGVGQDQTAVAVGPILTDGQIVDHGPGPTLARRRAHPKR